MADDAHVPAADAARIGGDRGVVLAARALRARGEVFALALVVASEGSTYRKPGALALVAADGARRGVISGGCLEPGLDAVAAEVLRDGAPRLAEFDTRDDDDLLFGSGSGCRGRLRVLVMPVWPARAAPLFEAIARAHDRHQVLRLALCLQGDALGRGAGRCGADALGLGLDAAGVRALLDDAAAEPHLATPEGREAPFAVFAVRPPPRLLLFGAAPEAPTLARIARGAGWIVEVADHRQTPIAAMRGEADRVFAARPAAALTAIAAGALDAAIVMTHTASADLEALRALAAYAIGYVGLLGPPARRDELLAQLDEAERVRLRPRLHAPVGLALGGEGPEAIALSIAAGLQRHFAAIA